MHVRSLCTDEFTYFRNIYQHYMNLLQTDVDDYATGQIPLRLPHLADMMILKVLSHASKLFHEEPNVLSLKPPLVVLGDVHGHILDLFRIMQSFPKIPNTTFLFLGDFVDRGEFSTETIIFILILKIIFPTNIYLLRGNHEFYGVFKKGGFSQELKNDMLSENFALCFSYMPLAAIIENTLFCVHGGIGPDFNYVEELQNVPKPLHNFMNKNVADALWSDPDASISMYEKSKRGNGHTFGEEALNTFLINNKFTHIIRGHQCVDDGVSYQFRDRVVTVFSASNYCGTAGNRSGCLKINSNLTFEVLRFDPLEYIKREKAVFESFSFGPSTLIKIGIPEVNKPLFDSAPSIKKVILDNKQLTSSTVLTQSSKMNSLNPNGGKISVSGSIKLNMSDYNVKQFPVVKVRTLFNSSKSNRQIPMPLKPSRRKSVVQAKSMTPDFSNLA
ncbi:Ser/Thr protein phosphatase [Tritrichomonas foetus]|uniref:Serine/threonine-protein phosphatase n=1 Tax=Tritrichomonas foetus TaxID=1144522 RepID=A0A1J4JHP7_9EUKA|nr:Ser/Thr protein phosphatase [Tritrichomonas foetus]|eukprot:OHS98680.1 Ser/Thr protein phosphatase [Tritrichomonas foetus]